MLVFSRGYVRNRPEFTFGNVELAIDRDYQYLRLIFNYNRKFDKAKQKLYEKGNRAMFSLLRKVMCLLLFFDVLLKLFNHIVVPIITYGCEIWESGNIDIIEKLQLRFVKYILNVNKITCSNMVYGEVGTPPLIVNIKSIMLLFWSSLIICDKINNRCNKISSILFRLLLKLHVLDVYTSPWLMFFKYTLHNIGLSSVRNSQSLPASREFFRQSIKVRLINQFIHQWITEINESGKCIIYRTFKTTFNFENYLISLARQLEIIFTKFRCRNHRLPKETGCRERVLREIRVCTKCNIAPRDFGDEFHYLFVCDYFKTERI